MGDMNSTRRWTRQTAALAAQPAGGRVQRPLAGSADRSQPAGLAGLGLPGGFRWPPADLAGPGLPGGLRWPPAGSAEHGLSVRFTRPPARLAEQSRAAQGRDGLPAACHGSLDHPDASLQPGPARGGRPRGDS
jgi:hypothetical protein